LEKINDFQKYISEYSLFLYLEMALLKYLTLKQHNTMNTLSECLPDASGPLAICGSITAANSNVVQVLEKQQYEQTETKRQRDEYHIYMLYYQNIYIWCRDISWQVSNNNIFSGYCNHVYIVYVR